MFATPANGASGRSKMARSMSEPFRHYIPQFHLRQFGHGQGRGRSQLHMAPGYLLTKFTVRETAGYLVLADLLAGDRLERQGEKIGYKRKDIFLSALRQPSG